MAAVNQYPQLGPFSIVPAADLTDIDSAANARSPARVGDAGFGKRGGMIVVRDSSGSYSLVMALGDTPGALWRVVDGSAEYTPA
jgi:hypothetical protein